MKRLILVFLMILYMMTILCFAAAESNVFWGSFTPEKTYSFDHRYYALQTVENPTRTGSGMIRVTICLTETDEAVFSFLPGRSWDFWGICWERDSYNIWTQSADTGCHCWEYLDSCWQQTETLKLPDYIVSRYDNIIRSNPELWDTVYHSPTD